MPRQKSHWRLVYGVAGKETCRHGSIWTDKRDAAYFAREENKYCPEHRGRGVKPAPCDEWGNIDWRRV